MVMHNSEMECHAKKLVAIITTGQDRLPPTGVTNGQP